MEYRRRTFSNVLKDDIEKQIYIQHTISTSTDEHTKYVYNGTFSIFNTVIFSFIKLICCCCIRK